MLVLGGEEMNGIVKKALYIVLGVAMVVLGDKALVFLGLTGALVV
jgi:type IV secretion system protein VirB2